MRIKASKTEDLETRGKNYRPSGFKSIKAPAVLILLAIVYFFFGYYFQKSGWLESIISSVENVMYGWRKEITDELSLYLSNGLETVYLDIPFESLQSIKEKRDEALETGILLSSDDDFMPASISFDGLDNVEIKIRLKGDWTDHLEGEKWSYRIHFVEEIGSIFGMRRFSLQAPETRNFIFEWALHQAYIQEGILTTRYNFVNVLINGEYKGIYAIEESFSTELMESQKRREGVILRFDENMLWENRVTGYQQNGYDEPVFLITNEETADITLFREGRIINNPDLNEQAQKAVSMLSAYQAREAHVEDIFDVELFGRFFALTDYWSGNHGTYWHNMRYYYNPISGLIEPIGFDNAPDTMFTNKQAAIMDKLQLFSEPLIREAYARELDRYTRGSYSSDIKGILESKYNLFVDALRKEYGEELPLVTPWSTLQENSRIFRDNLHPITPVYGSYHFIPRIDNGLMIRVDLYNAYILPVELIQLSINGTFLDLNDLQLFQDTVLERQRPYPFLNFYEGGFIKPDQFIIPTDFLSEPNPDELEIIATMRIAGLSDDYPAYDITLRKEWATSNTKITSRPQPENLEHVLANHSFLKLADKENSLVSIPGEWNVSGDLIVPSDHTLYLTPGTTLLFEEGAILFSDQAPLQIKGTESQPVILDSQTTTWGGVVVFNAEETSIWNWAVVRNTSAINRDGWMLTGGITFYQSPINISKSYISSTSAEDAINVVSTQFFIEDTVFAFTPSDAFDADFTAGEIHRCSFHDIGGDALDFSGSQIKISEFMTSNIVDKGISAGENSTVEVINFELNQVGIGIASKDLSEVFAQQGIIRDARVVALAAYIKKPQFGPASIVAQDVLFQGMMTTLCQTNSTIYVNGVSMPTKDMDIDLLYASEFLGN